MGSTTTSSPTFTTSFASSQTAPSTHSTPAPPPVPAQIKQSKLRSHLLALLPLPKHALFHAKVTIHDVSSVPFLDGQFACKWRFKNSHATAAAAAVAEKGMEDKIRPAMRRIGSAASLKAWKGKGKETAPAPAQPQPKLHSAQTTIDISHATDDESSSSSSRAGTGRTTPMPGDPAPQYGPFLTPNFPPHPPPPPRRPPYSAQPSYFAHPPPPALPQPGALNFVSQPKGQTPYVPLEGHSATWSLDVDAAVQMSLARGSGGSSEPCTPGFGPSSFSNGHATPGTAEKEREKEKDWPILQPSELKLTVIKHLEPHERKDDLQRENATLGTVSLNLAEYANEGSITRRYLLRQSKTNATLRLTVEVSLIGGEGKWRKPPLEKGQILGSVRGLISEDHLRTHALSPFHPPSSGSSSSSLYLPRPAFPSSSAHFLPGPNPHPLTHSRQSSISTSPSPTHDHPSSTESIIEALFNPFPSTAPVPGPFSYYRAPPAPGSIPSPDEDDGDGEEPEDDDAGTAGQTERGRERRRGWWRKRERERDRERQREKENGGGEGREGKKPWRWKSKQSSGEGSQVDVLKPGL